MTAKKKPQLELTSILVNPGTEEKFLQVKFEDRLGKRRDLKIPAANCHGTMTKAFDLLAGELYPNLDDQNVKSEIRRILAAGSAEEGLLIDRMGWFDRAYVFPESIYGDIDKRIEPDLNGPLTVLAKFSKTGTLRKWQREIGDKCRGNSRLVFAVCVAFSAPLLELLKRPGTGFNLYGDTRIGKTVALIVAGSVWGGHPDRHLLYVESWDMSAQGPEALIAIHNDALLCLDELSQSNPQARTRTLHKLGDGCGRARANKHGQLAASPSEWRTQILSSANAPASVYGFYEGDATGAAASLRFIEIPADAGTGNGLFEDTHGRDGADFAHSLEEAARNNYGVPIHRFLKELTGAISCDGALVNELSTWVSTFCVEVGADKNQGEGFDRASRFGTVYAAGMLAKKFGIIDWNAAEILNAVRCCYRDHVNFLKAQASTQIEASRQILMKVGEYVRALPNCPLIKNGMEIAPLSYKMAAAFRRRNKGRKQYLLRRAPFEAALNQFLPRHIQDALISAGCLVRGTSDNRPIRQVKIGDRPKEGFYVIDYEKLRDAVSAD